MVCFVLIRNRLTMLESMIFIPIMAYRPPMQFREPALNAIKAFALRPTLRSGRKRSGSKQSASGPQISLRRCVAYMLSTIRLPLGIANPPISISRIT
uniref:Putative secreted protein n=1 Tax=Anopheles darlingi TaxID=43151 RepID=A0A2M4D9D2_ANODA